MTHASAAGLWLASGVTPAVKIRSNNHSPQLSFSFKIRRFFVAKTVELGPYLCIAKNWIKEPSESTLLVEIFALEDLVASWGSQPMLEGKVGVFVVFAVLIRIWKTTDHTIHRIEIPLMKRTTFCDNLACCEGLHAHPSVIICTVPVLGVSVLDVTTLSGGSLVCMIEKCCPCAVVPQFSIPFFCDLTHGASKPHGQMLWISPGRYK